MTSVRLSSARSSLRVSRDKYMHANASLLVTNDEIDRILFMFLFGN